MIQPHQIKFLDIELTSFCNLHCPQCDRFDLEGHTNRYMDLAHLDFFQVLSNLELPKLCGLETLLLEGDHGDPLMHPQLQDIIAELQTVPKIKLVTNASLQSPQWWKNLAAFTNLEVTFSIDGLEDTNHLYRINSNYQKIMTNARAFISSGGRAIWKFIVFQHNEHQVEQARALSRELGFQDFVSEVSNRNFYSSNKFPVMIHGQPQQRSLEIASSTKPRKKTSDAMAIQPDRNNYRAPRCSWLNNGKIYLDYRGNLIPCCMTSGLMWRKDISGQLWQRLVGDLDSINLYHHSLSEILSSDFYNTRLVNSFNSIKTVHHVCFGNCSNSGADSTVV